MSVLLRACLDSSLKSHSLISFLGFFFFELAVDCLQCQVYGFLKTVGGLAGGNFFPGRERLRLLLLPCSLKSLASRP